MKQNSNNLKVSDYYLGLDIGTNSVGWAATDIDYNVKRFHGNSMWGVRLFEEAKSAEERRLNRTARRRLARNKQRLTFLEMLFSNEIAKIDPVFFARLRESYLHPEDRANNIRYSLFAGEGYTDREYFQEYPTIYHLRSELLHSQKEHDARLVFLALHHIIKHRGHFLYDLAEGENKKSIYDFLEELNLLFEDNYGCTLCRGQEKQFAEALIQNGIGITKKKALLAEYVYKQEASEEINVQIASDALAGAKIEFSKLFCDEALKEMDPKSISLEGDLDEFMERLENYLSETQLRTIVLLKETFDGVKLSLLLGSYDYLSDAKVALFEQNKQDLQTLKAYVRKNAKNKYRYIFSEKKKKLNNYAAYSRYKHISGDYACTIKDFCAFLKKELPEMKDCAEMESIWKKIENNSFLLRLRGIDNGLFPYQLHKAELCKILENASSYLPFLKDADPDGHSVKEKIITVFEFKIPYYVGPLNQKSPNAWIVRTGEKIYPWNYSEVVNAEKSAEKFLIRLVGRCSYTGNLALPMNSIIYSRYCVLNELNSLKLNGNPIPVDIKQQIYREMFCASPKKVTKKEILKYLFRQGLAKLDDEISGIDNNVKSSLKSYHDFKEILNRTKDEEMVENIIQHILVFGEDRQMLRRWLDKSYPVLRDDEKKKILRLRYKDWGRLSKEFLTGIFTTNRYGEEKSVMDCLWETNDNLMQILSDRYTFMKQIEEQYNNTKSIHEQLDEMYIAPAVRRSVWQALKIVDEIVDIEKSAPKKVFVEVARESRDKVKKERTESRKSKLIELYKACGEESNELFKRLCNEEENALRRDKLYLYYTQFGKCMYSGESISDISAMLADNSTYDIDHIFPQSKIRDDSLDNRVLVKSILNREKESVYPIAQDIRTKMRPFWSVLLNKGLISRKKYERLIRNTELTEEELAAFVSRQIVSTQQSTKAVATLLGQLYPKTRIVFSKAGNVSDFRHKYGFVKCREANDFHHAKDAYLNVVVGNVYDTKFTENFFRNIRKENYSLNKVFEFDVPGAWKKDGGSIAAVRKYMVKNNILVTRKAYEEKGVLFDLLLKPAGQGQHPVKNGLDIKKYGGYNKIKGAYFFVVEHTDKKKRVRSIEPVFIYAEKWYREDPEDYCRVVLGLDKPRVVERRINIDAVLEIDGSRLLISGRTGDRYVFKHTYQLVLSQETERYINNMIKYVERCASVRRTLDVSHHDCVHTEGNIDLYQWFCKKLEIPQYNGLLSSVYDFLMLPSTKESFTQKSVLEQCKILLEVLKAFKCDAQNANFSELGGGKTVGRITYSKRIDQHKSVGLINQSVTGLFETRVNLLG